MADPISTGATGSGHGRGMSQWGLSALGGWESLQWNAMIAYSNGNSKALNLYSMNADGTGVTRLTNSAYNYMPTWSPGGSQIAFTGPTSGLYSMNADGSGQKLLVQCCGGGNNELWSPNWSKSGNNQILYYTSDQNSSQQIYVTDASGASPSQLTSGSQNNADPDWSPDGSKIVFTCGGSDSALCIMNADGSGVVQIPNEDPGLYRFFSEPKWSPDGTKIVASASISDTQPIYGWAIVVMNPDGSNLTQLTTLLFIGQYDNNPSWLSTQKIVFSSSRDHPTSNPALFEIYIMDASGANQTRLTNDSIPTPPNPACSWCRRFDSL